MLIYNKNGNVEYKRDKSKSQSEEKEYNNILVEIGISLSYLLRINMALNDLYKNEKFMQIVKNYLRIKNVFSKEYDTCALLKEVFNNLCFEHFYQDEEKTKFLLKIFPEFTNDKHIKIKFFGEHAEEYANAITSANENQLEDIIERCRIILNTRNIFFKHTKAYVYDKSKIDSDEYVESVVDERWFEYYYDNYYSLYEKMENQKVLEYLPEFSFNFKDDGKKYYEKYYDMERKAAANFIFYLEGKKEKYRRVKNELDKIGCEDSDDEKTMIFKYLDSYISEDEIKPTPVEVLTNLRSYKNDFVGNYYELYEQCKEDFKKYQAEYLEKKEIEELLSDNTNKKTTMVDIDLMDGYQFENFVVELFRNMGYSAYQTQKAGDQGVDVIAKKNNEILAIQAKHYNSNSVGNKAIQEIVAGMKYYNASKGMVVTNSSFTPSAKELAQKNNVILWDRDMLRKKI